MKSFRKTEDGLFICEECGRTFKICTSLSTHIGIYHGNKKEYYDKWVKKDDEGICKHCGKETKYLNRWDRGYALFCCKKCKKEFGMPEEAKLKMVESCKKTFQEKYGVDSYFQTIESIEKRKQTKKERYGDENYHNMEQTKKTNKERYGAEYTLQVLEIREKGKQTKKEKYGDENYRNDEQIKKTCLEKYNVDNPWKAEEVKRKIVQTIKEKYGVEYYTQTEEHKEKSKETCLEHFGVENPSQSLEIKEKKKQTCLKNHGVENPSQNKEIAENQLKSACKLKNYKDTELLYQGTYEFDFLEKYYEAFEDEIRRAESIKYRYKNKNCVYHPDFFIPSLNLIIECKNSWLVERDKYVLRAKKKATIASGYNYIMIVDKDYMEFNNYLQK